MAYRSVADQDVTELGGAVSVLARQKKDHITLDRLLGELAGSSGEAQAAVLTRIYRLVFPHAFAEESVLWPVMRRALSDRHELTLEVEQEHQEVNELVTRLETLDLDDPAREPLLDRLAAVLREDVRDEEDELLPRLQAVTDRRTLRRLGVYWEVVRRVAPTRAHPVVARRPPGNVLAALPLTVVDRLRGLLGATAPRRRQDRCAARTAVSPAAPAESSGSRSCGSGTTPPPGAPKQFRRHPTPLRSPLRARYVAPHDGHDGVTARHGDDRSCAGGGVLPRQPLAHDRPRAALRRCSWRPASTSRPARARWGRRAP